MNADTASKPLAEIRCPNCRILITVTEKHMVPLGETDELSVTQVNGETVLGKPTGRKIQWFEFRTVCPKCGRTIQA